MLFTLTDKNSLGNTFLAELRDVEIQKDRLRFRRNLERIGAILAYEISQKLAYEPMEVETPLGMATHELPMERIVLATILRAGLPFHQGMLAFFDEADNAFISAYRKEHKDGSLEIQLDYVSTAELDDAVLILCDPMLATGASVITALEHLLVRGTPKAIHVASVIASTEGVNALRRRFPKVSLWIGTIDEELTAKSFIVPGLGDAGDLAYGEKI
ncbi:MAG: uracil phosphoribosyltransferase [Lewinellaceae bacterium]|nr:uracil phosphoribosyltransferase [Lewinellaceae bacterium]